MPDEKRFGKSYKSYEPRTRKERNIYNESLRRAQEAQKQGRTPGKYLKGQIAKHGWTDPSKASFTGSLPNLRQTFKPVTAMFADFMGQGLGSFMESEKARVGGKFNAPLNVQYGTPAYKWLLEDVIKDEEDQDDFRREVAKGNLSWTELNKYADDEYIGGGQLARGINERNEGIIGSDIGAEALANAYRSKANETGDGAIGNALWAYDPEMFNQTPEMWEENMAGSEPYNTWSNQGADPIYGGRSPIDELYAATTTMNPFNKNSSPVSRQYKDMWLANLIEEEDDTPLGLI
jgi:hypothetical protein